MARPKSDGLPKYLYFDSVKGYRFTLINGKRVSLGADRHKAISIANQYNLQMRPEQGIDTLLTMTSVNNKEKFSDSLPDIHERILKREGLSPKVRDGLRMDMERAKEFLTMHPHDIDLGVVDKYLNHYHGHLAGDSFNKKISFLKKVFAYAIDMGLIKENPAEYKLPKKPVAKKRKRLTLEQFKKIHFASPLWLQTAMDLSLQTTHARLEISRIRYRIVKPSQDTNGCLWFKEPKLIDGQNVHGELYINRQKTEKNEEAHVVIPIGDAIKRIIDKSRQDKLHCPFVVHREPERNKEKAKDSEHPYQVTPDFLSRQFSEYRDKSGACNHLPQDQRPTFHEIRALASHLLDQQGYDAQSRMGHKDARSTRTYTQDHLDWVQVPHVEIAI